jgi:hypothetical protein
MDILKDLHASIAETCEASFTKANRELKSQITSLEKRANNAEQNAAVATVAQQAAEARFQELQSQVTALREELSHLEINPQDLELPTQLVRLEDEFDPELVCAVNPDNTDQLKETFTAKYTALYTNLQVLVQGWNSLKLKVLQHKKKLRRWDKMLELDEFTLVLDGVRVTFRKVQSLELGGTHTQGINSGLSSNPASTDTANSSHASGTSENDRHSHGQDRATLTTANVKTEVNSLPMDLGNRSEIPASDPSNSGPGRVSPPDSFSDTLPPLPTGSIQNRKRKPDLPVGRHETIDRAVEQPVAVKNEPISSSPSHYSIHSIGQHFPSTQDLDAIGNAVRTPTKRTTHREKPRESQIQRANWSPGDRDRVDYQLVQQESALQPVDGNARMDRHVDQEPGIKKQKIADQHGMSLMTKGKGHTSPEIQTSKKASKSSATARSDRSTAKAYQISGSFQPHDPTEESLQSKSPQDSCNLNIRSDRARSHASASTQRSGILPHDESESQGCPEIRPEDEPYRARPLHRLGLSHFKINPASNQGLDYAYSTVVRKKDDRKCISGCTRPGCCGDRFRAMARLGGMPQTNSTEPENQRLLEEYIGEDRHLLKELSDQGRERLLVEARARVIANQYGRHRHTHQRPQTPPGFWRTDMPDTQELEADREAASRLERDKVEERYREAMRPGGLWTWADE